MAETARVSRRTWILAGAGVVAVGLVVGGAMVVPWWLDERVDPSHARIAAGWAHSCAVTGSGGVRCWGANTEGQLGDGTAAEQTGAVEVEGLSGPVAALSGSGNHTCALTTAGAVQCWGDNSRGQLGDGTTTASLQASTVPGLESGVRTVSAGAGHTCALTDEREVQCWGANGSGQLGTGDTIDRLAPARVAELPTRVTDVSVGNGFTCVVFTGRTVRCWGDNSDGQLGSGDTDPRLLWEPITTLPRTGFVTAGEAHACTVTGDGKTWCWGANGSGQLGADSAGDHSATPLLVDAVPARTASAGGDRTCTITKSGTVECWGGSPEDPGSARPREVAGIAGADSVAVGATHACATTAEGVRCWGGNTAGQLGDGTTEDRAEPVAVAGV